MANIAFTKNYTDHSNSEGCQFEFFCDKCGQQMPADGKFCPGCGAPRA